MTDLLISDLHLQPDREDLTRLFNHFITGPAYEGDRLFILGDFFEYWIGDDFSHPWLSDIEQQLRNYTATGRTLVIMHGNRDFLIGQTFCDRVGAKLLAEPSVETIGGIPSLITHGDELCTDDLEYQAFRRKVRDPEWQAAFLSQPLASRIAFAENARSHSRQKQAEYTESITDVNPDAVLAAFRTYDVHRMIHGHTHRQAIHQIECDGRLAERIVLGDWGKTGCYCQCHNGHRQLINFVAA